MEIIFKITYEQVVVSDDISRLSAVWKKKVREAIEEKLTRAPDTFGKPLRRSLKGYRKLRVGDYRVIFRIDNNTVSIFAILHRSVVYQEMEKR
jgi:mRNA interferase RelE/StbE